MSTANAISLNLNVNVRNGSFVDSFNPGNISASQATPGRGGQTQSIPTTAGGTVLNAALPTGAAEGYCCLQNLDATNYLTWGVQSGGSMVTVGTLNPGEPAVFRLAAGVVLMAIANAAAVLLDARIYCN